jgi:hypothetical protein
MNLHHTAALALVGWYMTVPPSGCNGRPNTKPVVQVGSDLDLRQQRQFQRDASSIEAPETNASHDASRWILEDAGYDGPTSVVEAAQCARPTICNAPLVSSHELRL